MWTQEELDALKAAYASGTLSVSYEGKSVTYASEKDLIKRIRTIEKTITTNKTPTRSFASFNK